MTLQVRKVTGLDCSKRPNWCKMLLQQVSPQLEELQVSAAKVEHLDVIRDMTGLRKLDLQVSECMVLLQ